MTAVAALVVGLLLIIGLGALVGVLAGFPPLAIVVITTIATAAAFYLLTNSLLKRRVAAKKPAPVPMPGAHEGDHIS